MKFKILNKSFLVSSEKKCENIRVVCISPICLRNSIKCWW